MHVDIPTSDSLLLYEVIFIDIRLGADRSRSSTKETASVIFCLSYPQPPPGGSGPPSLVQLFGCCLRDSSESRAPSGLVAS